MVTRTSIAANSRELIVQLSRGNRSLARELAESIHSELNSILESEVPAETARKHCAQQTMFAVEEVLALVDQGDLRDAWEAARDAAKEWRAAAARE